MKRIKILTCGVFDYFHIGHLQLFEQCKRYGNYLIVGVKKQNCIHKTKPNTKVLYTEEQRLKMVKSLKIVDEVILYTFVTPRGIGKIDFDILALGEDHTGKRFNTIKEWCKTHNKKVIYMKRTPGICSTNIRERLLN